MKLFSLALTVLALAGVPGSAEEPSAQAATMTKVSVRTLSSLSEDARISGVTTFYRSGEGMGRVEFPPDEKGVSRVTIVNEGDIWLVDLTNHIAQHKLDAGPTQRFVAPILPSAELPAPLDALEFGREDDFLARHGGKPTPIELAPGKTRDRYEIARHGFTLVFFTEHGTRRPRTLEILGEDGLMMTIVYQAYQRDLALDASLFSPPEDVRIFERPTPAVSGGDDSAE